MEQNEIVSFKGDKYLVIRGANDTLATMVMLKQVPIYWLGYHCGGEVDSATQVTDPTNIYGGTPNVFAIKLPKTTN